MVGVMGFRRQVGLGAEEKVGKEDDAEEERLKQRRGMGEDNN